jgi:tetratricopeptide (TPR) repeat protein
MVAEIVSHYRVIRKLGAGGMGEVYLAEDTTLHRKVALKLLSGDYTRNDDALRRFVHEAQAASALNHPNILTIHEFGQQDGVQFIATEFVEGQTLRQRLAGGKMSLADTLDITIQVAAALGAAHQAGIVHRDIKPENIMLRPDGYVKVLDFGVAKLTEHAAASHAPESQLANEQAGESDSTLLAFSTEPGVVMGTPNYMSPEQVRGYAVDSRSDIFSLGVVIYELVTGHQPFQGPTFSDVIAAILTSQPPPISQFVPGARQELQGIFDKAIAKNRDHRYQSAQELLVDMRSLRRETDFQTGLAGLGTTAGGERATAETTPTERITTADHAGHLTSAEYIINEIKRHKIGAGAIALALLVAIAAVFFFFRPGKAGGLTERDTVLLADFANTTGEPVFDETLKQALATQLEQSPFLNIFPEARIRETLKFMGQPADARVTEDVARQVCQRQGIKALLAGSITSLGSHYVISLEAINAASGDVIARNQIEADSREKVLTALGTAASGLRKKLGESLSSIEKFDAPVDQVTTPSLEALKSFAAGDARRDSGDVADAIPFYKHATELDPNFALAYARLAAMYGDSAQPELAAQYSQKAFGLRDRVSEREKLYISSHYYSHVTGEFDKQIEVLRLWQQTYPRDFIPYNNLAVLYIGIGQPDQAEQQAREAIRINPGAALPRLNLCRALQMLGRYDEEKELIQQSLATNPADPMPHAARYWIAFLEHDKPAKQQEAAWVVGKPMEPWFMRAEASAAASEGRLAESTKKYAEAAELLKKKDPGGAAGTALAQIVTEEMMGKFDRVENRVKSIIPAAGGNREALSMGGIAFCLTGRPDSARPLMDELAKRYPKDTLVNDILLPAVAATEEIARGNPSRAVELLQVSRQYEFGEFTIFWTAYTRGLAYLRAGSGAQALTEFQRILDHRGVDITSHLYPLSQLGLARAAALAGEIARSRKAYEYFFELWKDAEPDVPVLLEAKREYERLK